MVFVKLLGEKDVPSNSGKGKVLNVLCNWSVSLAHVSCPLIDSSAGDAAGSGFTHPESLPLMRTCKELVTPRVGSRLALPRPLPSA